MPLGTRTYQHSLKPPPLVSYAAPPLCAACAACLALAHTNHTYASFPAIFLCILCMSQVKSFDADVVEAQGYKGAIAAADELKGLLEGSKAVGSRKGLSTEQQAAYSSLPQVR